MIMTMTMMMWAMMMMMGMVIMVLIMIGIRGVYRNCLKDLQGDRGRLLGDPVQKATFSFTSSLEFDESRILPCLCFRVLGSSYNFIMPVCSCVMMMTMTKMMIDNDDDADDHDGGNDADHVKNDDDGDQC